MSKANQMLGFLQRNCIHLTDMKCRRSLYLALVRAHLCYGSELWAPQSTSKDLLYIEGVQQRASIYVLQDYHSFYADRINLLPILYWYDMKYIISFYNIKSGLYEPKPRRLYRHPTRHLTCFSSTNCYRPNLHRTAYFKSSFFNRIVPLWNNLPEDLKSYTQI